MALHYGHNYKMSRVFGECERINRVQEDEQKPLLGNCLFLYQPVPPCSRPQLPLVMLDIQGGRLLGCWEKGNVTAVLVIIKGSGYLRDILIYTGC